MTGYHSEQDLEKIKDWPFHDSFDLIEFVAERWHWGESQIERRWVKDRFSGYEYEITFHTGGWSGNEELIMALTLDNRIFNACCYYAWRTGGHHTFRLNPKSFGYIPVSEFLKNAGFTRQNLCKQKEKYDWLIMSDKKRFVRKKQ